MPVLITVMLFSQFITRNSDIVIIIPQAAGVFEINVIDFEENASRCYLNSPFLIRINKAAALQIKKLYLSMVYREKK